MPQISQASHRDSKVHVREAVEPFGHRVPEITILSDHATQDRDLADLRNDDVARAADQDRLELHSRLASTFDILRHKNTRCPLAVAVYGDWGTGKTSAMRWLETKLNDWNKRSKEQRKGHPRAYTVWFDPWRYHTREEVWRGIIAEVIIALFTVEHLDRENLVPRLVQAAKKFGSFLGRSFIHALANIEFKFGDSKATGEMKFSGEAFRDIWEEYEKAARPHEAHLNQFEETLRHWVTSFLGEVTDVQKGKTQLTREAARLVIFIDDLDRCLPAVTLEVIEALKLYLNIPHLIFVVGLDETVVRSVVTKHYKESGVEEIKAARYLDKVFQVDLRIPPSEARMSGYMRQQIEVLNQSTENYWATIMDRSGHRSVLEDSLISLARNNPREVKRLLNSALLRGRAASLDPTLSHVSDSETGIVPDSDQARANRFAQGVQVFLLQRWLGDKHLNAADRLTERRTAQWFQEASELVITAFESCDACEPKVLHSYLSDITFQKAEANKTRSMGAGPDDEAMEKLPFVERYTLKLKNIPQSPFETAPPNGQAACAALHDHLTTSPPWPEPEQWISIFFLQVMQVPFSRAVAEHFPPTRNTVVARPHSLDLAALDPIIRERLAAAADVPVDDLQLAHLRNIEELDLSSTPINSQQLRQLFAAMQLKHLNLSGCTGLVDTHALAGLQGLFSLELDACSGLQGRAAFEGIAGLRELLLLSLNACDGLSAEDEAWLRKQFGPKTEIIKFW